MTDHLKRKANAIDIHVGSQLRLKRQSLGLSQQGLGERLGITFQQMQKYEKGTNRISAGRLFELSQVLGVDVGWFYKGLLPSSPAQSAASQTGDILYDPVALRAARNLMRIKDRKVRLKLVRTIEVLAED